MSRHAALFPRMARRPHCTTEARARIPGVIVTERVPLAGPMTGARLCAPAASRWPNRWGQAGWRMLSPAVLAASICAGMYIDRNNNSTLVCVKGAP